MTSWADSREVPSCVVIRHEHGCNDADADHVAHGGTLRRPWFGKDNAWRHMQVDWVGSAGMSRMPDADMTYLEGCLRVLKVNRDGAARNLG